MGINFDLLTNVDFKKIYLSDNLRYLRETFAQMSQKDFAQKLGLKPSTYNNYETGHSNPSYLELTKFSVLYGLSIGVLLHEEISKQDELKRWLADKINGSNQVDVDASIKTKTSSQGEPKEDVRQIDVLLKAIDSLASSLRNIERGQELISDRLDGIEDVLELLNPTDDNSSDVSGVGKKGNTAVSKKGVYQKPHKSEQGT